MNKIRNRKRSVSIGGILLLLMLLQAGPVYAAQTGEKTGTQSPEYEVTFTVTSKWEGAFRGELCIRNTGTEPIEDWSLQMVFPHEFEDISGAKILSHEENTYLLRHEDWNRRILPEESVTVSFGAKWETRITEPSGYQLYWKSAEEKEEACQIVYQLESDWGSGFTAVIRITNCTDRDMEGWRLSFDFNREIKSIWDAGLEKKEGNHYVIRNAGYNSVIRPGETVSFGITGTGGGKEDIPGQWKLSAAAGAGEEKEETETVCLCYFPEKKTEGEPREFKERLLRLLYVTS